MSSQTRVRVRTDPNRDSEYPPIHSLDDYAAEFRPHRTATRTSTHQFAGLQVSPACAQPIQRQADDTLPAKAPPYTFADRVPASGGRPLDPGTRDFMERRFSHDFSSVRIHTDEEAAESAKSVNALAYTAGLDIVFGRGRYAPSTFDGGRLLAHELTHVVQQSGGEASPDAVLQRQAGDATQTSITPAFAQALSDPELDQQVNSVRNQLNTLTPSDDLYSGARENLGTLEAEVSRRNLQTLTDQGPDIDPGNELFGRYCGARQTAESMGVSLPEDPEA